MGFFKKFEKHVIRKPVHEVRRFIAQNPPIMQVAMTIAAFSCPVWTPAMVAAAGAVGSAADAAARHDEIKHKQKIEERKVEQNRQEQQARVAAQRAQVTQQVATARAALQTERQEINTIHQNEQTRIDRESTQHLQEIANARVEIELDEQTLRAARELLSTYLRESRENLTQQARWIAALIEACSNRNHPEVKRLLKCLDPRLLLQIGNDLMEICDIDDIEIISNLVNKEIKSILKPKNSQKLLIAAQSGNRREIQEAVQAGADKEIRGANGMTPVLIAAHYGHPHCVQLLLESGADISAINNYGQNLICLAAVNNCHGVINLIHNRYPAQFWFQLNAGSSNHLQRTPLHATCYNRNCMESARLLLSLGADKEIRDENGETPAELAAQLGLTDLEQLIRNYPATGMSETVRRQLALNERLLNAARDGNNEELIRALNEGADVNARMRAGDTYAGYTPLLMAAHWGRLSTVQILLKRGANIKAKNTTNQAIVFLAAYNGDNARNWGGDGKRVLSYLFKVQPKKMQKQLHAIDQLPILATTVNNCRETARLLIDLGVDLNLTTAPGRTVAQVLADRDPALAEEVSGYAEEIRQRNAR